MPKYGTVRDWVTDDRQGFAARYRRAPETGNAKRGRPTLYTAEIADLILDGLGDGRTLTDVCDEPCMPSRGTVRLRERENREGF
jgi:terminase small subunit-like protein